MAQLSDDCFAFGGPLLSVDDAVEMIRARVSPVGDLERLPLSEAAGRVLAEDARAPVDVPSFDNSAVDGYAVRHCDLTVGGESVMTVSARIPAGSTQLAPIAPSTAVRIFTGAPMPEGADTVFMQEDVRDADGLVHLPAGLSLGANRRFAGEDFARGSVIAPGGVRLDPRRLAGLAAVGLSAVNVRRRVRVALFSTGDELVPPGGTLRPGAQFDSNRTLLAALAMARGAEVTDLGILPDRPAQIIAALDQAVAGHDVILTSGGVSTGEEDHVKTAVQQLGSLNFWRLAIKPGRPVAMGAIRGKAFVGLPGNPVAAFVTFVQLAGPLIDRLGGGDARLARGFMARSTFAYKKKTGRREYVRAVLAEDADGMAVVSKFPREGAALISSLIGTDGLVELPEESTGTLPGEQVRFLPYDMLI
jgi:molybdopterin molybdotransferase